MTRRHKRIKALVNHAEGVAENVVEEARSTAERIADQAREEGQAAGAAFHRMAKSVGKTLKDAKKRI